MMEDIRNGLREMYTHGVFSERKYELLNKKKKLFAFEMMGMEALTFVQELLEHPLHSTTGFTIEGEQVFFE